MSSRGSRKRKGINRDTSQFVGMSHVSREKDKQTLTGSMNKKFQERSSPRFVIWVVFIFLLKIICVYGVMGMDGGGDAWLSQHHVENNLWELVLSSHQVGPSDYTQIRIDSRHPYPLSPLPSPSFDYYLSQ